MSSDEMKVIVLAVLGKKTLLDGTRVMTEAELQNMSDGSFKGYYRRAKNLRKWAHNIEHSAEIVKTADYLAGAVERELRRREAKEV